MCRRRRSSSASRSRARASSAPQTEGALPVLTLDRAVHRAERRDHRDRADPESSRRCRISSRIPPPSTAAAAAPRRPSLHALPSKYTLVLIDGMRPAPAALSNTFRRRFRRQHQQHPAGCRRARGNPAGRRHRGVRLRCDRRRGQLHSQEELDRGQRLRASTPGRQQAAAAKAWNAGISKGFGDLAQGRLERHGDVQLQPPGQAAGDGTAISPRQGAYFPFTHNGVNYIFNNATGNTEPGNLTFQAVPAANPSAAPTRLFDQSVLPAERQLREPVGRRAARSDRHGVARADRRILPLQLRRHGAGHSVVRPPNFVGKGYYKLGDNATAWATVNLSHFDTNAAICSAGAAVRHQYHDARCRSCTTRMSSRS